MNFVNKTSKKIKADFFEKIAKNTFSYLNEKSVYDFDLVLVDKNRIKFLNKKYRRIDKVTDVLSFGLKEEKFLGQIFICLEQVFKQAGIVKRNNNDELAEVFVHGILHLLNYNDETESGYKKMILLQKKILKKINENY